jgi:hypothetical protein
MEQVTVPRPGLRPFSARASRAVRAIRFACALIACAVILQARPDGAAARDNVTGSFGTPAREDAPVHNDVPTTWPTWPTSRPLRRRPPAPTATSQPSTAIPNLVMQGAAAARIKSIYASDYANALYDARRALARKLIEEGDATKRDTDAKFAFYREAAEVAAGAGDVPTAFHAVDHLAATFPVVKLRERVKVFQTAVPLLTAPAANAVVTSMCLDLVDQCVVENEFEHAQILLDLAAMAADKSKKQTYPSWVKWKRNGVEAMRLAYAHVKPAEMTLKTVPDNPKASETVGRYVCLVKKDWDAGLPLIAKGADPALVALAERDLTCPEDRPGAQFDLADAWWAWGERSGSWDDELHVDARGRYRERAVYWYRQALPALDGLERATADRRITEIFPPATTEAARARRIPRPPDAMPFSPHVYRVHTAEVSWDTARRLCEEAGGHLVCLETRLENDYVVKLARGRTLWLGATFDAKGRWTWISGAGMFFSYWGHGQSDLADPQMRPQMGANGAWGTSTTRAGFICEWDD